MIFQGQNSISDSLLEGRRCTLCLGRIQLPVLPLKRQYYRNTKVYLGERQPPTVPGFFGAFSPAYAERIRLINKSRVALKVTEVTATFIGSMQYLYGQVESSGIAPNLRSTLRTERLEKICIMPRVVLKASDDVAGAYELVELITFDMIPFQDDDTLDRRPPRGI